MLDVPGEHGHELRVKARTPDRQRMADDPEHDAGNPQLQAQPNSGASVPLAIATVRGAPPIKIGSVSERCSGTSNPAAKVSGPLIRQLRRRS